MTTGRVFAYGLLGMPLAFAALPLYVHVPRFYAETTGLELGLLGGILLAARLLDAGIDPWLGWLADRVRRPQMTGVFLLPFVLGFVALLHPPQSHPAFWLFGTLALTYLGFSGASVAYQAWGAAIGPDSPQRTRLVAAREGFGLAGVLLAATLPGLLASDLQEGTARLAWVLPPLLLASACLTFIKVGTAYETPAHPPAGLLPSLRAVVALPRFRRLLTVFIANGFAAAVPATLFLFFVADVLAAEQASGPLLALYFLAGAASLPVWVMLARRHGRVGAWMAGMVLAILSFAGAGLLGAGDTGLFALICVASGLALGADLALPAAIAADLGESQGQSGACFGVWNFVAKLNLALAAGITLPLLSLLGYAPGATSGLAALSFTYAGLPLLFKLLALLLLWRWRHSLEIDR